MKEMFDENNYNFLDSMITKIEWDDNLQDLLIKIDCFQGENTSKILTIRLKNVKQLIFHNSASSNNIITAFTVAHISKKMIHGNIQLVIESVLSYLPEHENDEPLLICTCEDIMIEDVD